MAAFPSIKAALWEEKIYEDWGEISINYISQTLWETSHNAVALSFNGIISQKWNNWSFTPFHAIVYYTVYVQMFHFSM